MNNLSLRQRMQVLQLLQDVFFDSSVEEVVNFFITTTLVDSASMLILLKTIREPYHAFLVNEPEEWTISYNDIVFFQLYRMKKETFCSLLETIMAEDTHRLIKKVYRGGNYPVQPEKSLLIFLWYISKQDTFNSIADKFRVVPSTVMQIVNALLYIILGLKKVYIIFPTRQEDLQLITHNFKHTLEILYCICKLVPKCIFVIIVSGVIGAVDGTHINLKVSNDQHDSYADRYLSHSINLMAICTPTNLFTYIFVGFPGSAHDSRVFANSAFVRNIEQYGRQHYFPLEELHLIGDSAFPLRSWLMTPYKNIGNLTRMQRHHNFLLSPARVCIENTFGILKGRWRRLQFINTYSISKAIEITTVACILHNFCYLHNDEWNEDQFRDHEEDIEYEDNNREDLNLGRIKRDNIAEQLFNAQQ